MARAVLCPKCKSLLPLPFRARDVGSWISVSCPKCKRQVDGLITESEPSKGNEGGWAKQIEPTKEMEEEAEIIASTIPGVGALYALGNTKEVAKLIGLRLLSFAILFLFFGGTLAVHLSNPYFLVAVSCVFILLAHISCLVSDKVDFPAIIKDWDVVFIFPLCAYVLFILVPLVVFEILLLAINPLFILLDLVIAVLLFTALAEKKANR